MAERVDDETWSVIKSMLAGTGAQFNEATRTVTVPPSLSAHLAVEALDQAIADLAAKLPKISDNHRGLSSSIVEHIERLAAVRTGIVRDGHG